MQSNPIVSAFFAGFVLSLLFVVWRWYKIVKTGEQEKKRWPPFISPCPDYWTQSSDGKLCYNQFPEIIKYHDRVIKSGIEYASTCNSAECRGGAKGKKKYAFAWACDAVVNGSELGVAWDGVCAEYNRLMEEDNEKKKKDD